MRSRRLTSPGSIDLAAATSLAHKFESSEESSTVVESPVSGEGGRVSKTSSDKKKRHGLYVSTEAANVSSCAVLACCVQVMCCEHGLHAVCR